MEWIIASLILSDHQMTNLFFNTNKLRSTTDLSPYKPINDYIYGRKIDPSEKVDFDQCAELIYYLLRFASILRLRLWSLKQAQRLLYLQIRRGIKRHVMIWLERRESFFWCRWWSTRNLQRFRNWSIILSAIKMD